VNSDGHTQWKKFPQPGWKYVTCDIISSHKFYAEPKAGKGINSMPIKKNDSNSPNPTVNQTESIYHRVASFHEEDVIRMVREMFGLQIRSVKPLVGEFDQNFNLSDTSGKEYILKIAGSNEKRERLEAQNEVMKLILKNHTSLKCPAVIPTLTGEEIACVQGPNTTTHFVRLLNFLPGVFWSELKNHSPLLLEQLGSILGELDRVLNGFYHPALHRYLNWDLRNFADLESYITDIEDLPQRNLVYYFLQQFKAFVVPVFSKLRLSTIYNDANDNNILLDNRGETPVIKGIIDFGDMVYSHTVCELAVAIAYAIHGKDDPIETASRILAGYHKVFPLEEIELEVLFHLVCARLCSTLLISAHHLTVYPGNEYLKISVKPAFKALEKLITINPDHAARVFKQTCGFPNPSGPGKMDPTDILQLRKKHLGRNLSLSYSEPLKIVRGVMQYLYDHTGRAYLDTVNNVCHVGHCHPRVVDAAYRQMTVLNTNTRYLHENIVEYARRLCATLPGPLSVCYFVNSGSEANELALRLARAHTKNTDFIVIEHAYHGNTNAIIEISPYKFDGPGGMGKPAHVHKVSIPDVYRGTFKSDDRQAGEKYAADILKVTDELKIKNKKTAAFIHESLMGVAGQVAAPPNYFHHAYRLAREAGAVCIADEVQVGFGRVGTHMWGFETQGVIPDIVTMGKPIGNGHPLGAVVTTPEIADSFHSGMEYFNTFGGNPVSCAVGLAVLDVMRDEKLQENALDVGEYMKTRLAALIDKYEWVSDVRGMGLFLGIELVMDRKTLEPAKEIASQISNRMKQEGILISIDGPLHNVIKIKPPLVFTRDNADFYTDTLDSILKTIY